jgi:hypothetical protein
MAWHPVPLGAHERVAERAVTVVFDGPTGQAFVRGFVQHVQEAL